MGPRLTLQSCRLVMCPVPNAEPAGSAIVGWGANGTLMATPVAISTDPSGVIGGTQFDPAYQFSPNWLNGTEGGR